MAVADVSASIFLQGASSDLEVDEAQRLWLNGVLFGDNVPAERYQDSSNLTTVDDLDAQSVRNVKYVSGTTAEVDEIIPSSYGKAIWGADVYGGDIIHEGVFQTVTLPIPATYCQLRLHVHSTLAVSIFSAKFYAYDGINDANPYRGIEFRAAEGDVSTQWVEASGSSQALPLASHPLATEHDWYVAVSASPNSTGDKQGKIKFVFTYSQS